MNASAMKNPCAIVAFAAGALAALAAGVLGMGSAFAQDYPQRPIRLIVPFAPGGGTTAMARLVSDQVGAKLQQQILVDNREGAGGTIGSALAARSKPDGYTLLLAHSGTVAIAPHLYSKIAYDPLKDFTPVGIIAEIPLMLVVSAGVPAKTMEELLALARKQPGKLSYASGGVGTGGHLAAELFAAINQIRITHVPYKGSGPTIPDLLTGRVDMSLGPVVPFLPHIATGKLRALGMSSASRFPLVPDVRTMKEAGVPNYEIALFYGIVAPAGTPAAATQLLNREIRELANQAQAVALIEREGGVPRPVSVAEYGTIMAADYRKWGDAVKTAGVKIDE